MGMFEQQMSGLTIQSPSDFTEQHFKQMLHAIQPDYAYAEVSWVWSIIQSLQICQSAKPTASRHVMVESAELQIWDEFSNEIGVIPDEVTSKEDTTDDKNYNDTTPRKQQQLVQAVDMLNDQEAKRQVKPTPCVPDSLGSPSSSHTSPVSSSKKCKGNTRRGGRQRDSWRRKYSDQDEEEDAERKRLMYQRLLNAQ